MRLTRQSEIAIAILSACARRPDGYVHTQRAAMTAGATRQHTAKIAHLLLHAGLLRAMRGRGGGLGLALPAQAITLRAVLRHTQPELIETAEPGRGGRLSRGHLDIILHAAHGAFLALIDRFTIADLIAERSIQGWACSDCVLMKPACRSAWVAPHASCPERPDAQTLHVSR